MLSHSEKQLITTTIEYFIDDENFKEVMKKMLEQSGYAEVEVQRNDEFVEISGIDNEGDIWSVQLQIGEWIH